MIVLGYPQTTDDLSLVIPPFHTGHLGLIPGTQVHVGLMSSFEAGPRHCEVVVTPFHEGPDNLALLSCTLLDRIGVVGRLVSAVSDLGVNIVTLESTVLNHLAHHQVTMLIDLSTSSLRLARSSAHALQLYAPFQSCLPIDDERFVRLFEAIVAHTADVWTFKDVGGAHVPQLQIAPMAGHKFLRQGPARVERYTPRKYHVRVPLPDDVASQLLLSLETQAPLSYILFSDTEQRTLRAFFPRPDARNRTCHVGFYHNDKPGAIASLLRALALADFNILASLLRRQTATRSVWEAVLEYKGRQLLQDPSTPSQMCSWLSRLLAAHSDNHSELRAYAIQVGLPLYPRPKWNDRIELNPVLTSGALKPRLAQDPASLLTALRDALEKSDRHADDEARIKDVLSAVEERIRRTGKPIIFLSYPTAAQHHAVLLKARLRDQYDFDDYNEQDGEDILAQVLKKILHSDYFIGIWHHDEAMPLDDGKYSISPWMPFEYGVARAAEKQCLLIHSDKVHPDVWKRITPAVTLPSYSDLFFESKSLNVIADWCRRHIPPVHASTT